MFMRTLTASRQLSIMDLLNECPPGSIGELLGIAPIPPTIDDKPLKPIEQLNLPASWDNAPAQSRSSITWDNSFARAEQGKGTPESATAYSSMMITPLILPDDPPRLPARNACAPGAAPLLNSRHERFARLVA